MTGSLPFFISRFLIRSIRQSLLQTVVVAAALKKLGLGGDVGRVTGSAHSSGQGNYDDAVSGPYVGDLLLRATAGTAQKAVDQAMIIAAGLVFKFCCLVVQVWLAVGLERDVPCNVQSAVLEDVIAAKSTAILNVVGSVAGEPGLASGDGRPFDSFASDLRG